MIFLFRNKDIFHKIINKYKGLINRRNREIVPQRIGKWMRLVKGTKRGRENVLELGCG